MKFRRRILVNNNSNKDFTVTISKSSCDVIDQFGISMTSFNCPTDGSVSLYAIARTGYNWSLSVQVMMDGIDITSQVVSDLWSSQFNQKVINIPNITGKIQIDCFGHFK